MDVYTLYMWILYHNVSPLRKGREKLDATYFSAVAMSEFWPGFLVKISRLSLSFLLFQLFFKKSRPKQFESQRNIYTFNRSPHPNFPLNFSTFFRILKKHNKLSVSPFNTSITIALCFSHPVVIMNSRRIIQFY